MKARHRLGDHDGIRTLLRALTSAMGDLDAEPDDSMLQLVDELSRQPSGLPMPWQIRAA